MRLIDLSVPLAHDLPVDPPNLRVKIEYKDHIASVNEMLALFPGVGAEVLPEGYGWAVEDIFLTTHAGTHLDAPYHYHPTMSGGKRAWTIDEIPLDWCIGDGVVLDLSSKEDGYVCGPDDLKLALAKIEYELKEGDIVLIHTGAQSCWGTAAYVAAGCGIGREATLWLCEQGIRVMGTDAWSWDAPLGLIAKRYAEDGDPAKIWEGHKAGKDTVYCHYEKLTNLEKLPSSGFTFIGFPINIERAGGAWVRAVAMLKD